MKIVVDTNILFSYFWKGSLTRRLLITLGINLISPEIALKELEKYSADIIKKTKISEEIFKKEISSLRKIVTFVKKSDYLEFIKEADEICPDKNDSEFFALCLKNKSFLWSNDIKLKNQDIIKVFSTEEIIKILL